MLWPAFHWSLLSRLRSGGQDGQNGIARALGRGADISGIAGSGPAVTRWKMPTVLRWGPYRAFFYSNEEGEPAHIHVRSGGNEAKFWLHDLTVAVNAGFPAHEIGDIIRHLKQNRDELLDAWQAHFE
jgi:Domain of unknown function (DUF4160)